MGLFSTNKPKLEPVSYTAPPTATPPSMEKKAGEVPINKVTSTPSNPFSSTTTNNTKMIESINTISAGTILEGQLRLEGDLHVEGTIKGTVTSKSKVTLGANGKIEGDVNCQDAEISGKVMGKLNVNDMLFLKGNALVDGDISTGKLVIESGVRFNGKCSMGNKNAATNIAPSANNIAAQSNGTPIAAKVNA